MEEIMQGKIKRFRWVAIVGLALLVVPVAQALTSQEPAQSMHGSYATGTTFPNGTTGGYPFATSTATREAAAAQPAVTGIQVHYPFANENTAAFTAAEQKTNASPAPVSENSPVEQRLQTQSPSPTPVSENSPVEQRLNPSSPVSAASSGHSFDYGDAGIGAGLAALLTSMLALGAATRISRRRVAHG